ncbi:MAG: hypothetical protein AB7T14_01470 [Candidatus Methylacidiphilaceae bacterium]
MGSFPLRRKGELDYLDLPLADRKAEQRQRVFTNRERCPTDCLDRDRISRRVHLATVVLQPLA